jgi:cystathionine beta-lyase/cystathionine gamma-synthase
MAEQGIGTKCVQGGYTPGNGEPRQVPIVQSTTFKYASSAEMGKLFDLEAPGYFYTRLQNPTNDYVAAKIAALEGGTAAMLTSSGQAASFYAVFNIASCGDHVVSSSTIYGGTYNLFAVTMKRMGIDFTFVSPDCTAEELDAAFRPNTKAVFGETIANPALTVLDIEKFAGAAHAHGVPLIIDNTFATPVLCRPFEWGADIVTHSTTKYMDGHGAAVGGCERRRRRAGCRPTGRRGARSYRARPGANTRQDRGSRWRRRDARRQPAHAPRPDEQAEDRLEPVPAFIPLRIRSAPVVLTNRCKLRSAPVSGNANRDWSRHWP